MADYINWIAVRNDCTAITGRAENYKEACKDILTHADAWGDAVDYAIVGSADCKYNMDEVREIAEQE